ncbi:MAG: tetratricopeptide repeat protein [Myxococcota bacterium]
MPLPTPALIFLAALVAPPQSATTGNTTAKPARLSVTAVDSAPPRSMSLDEEGLAELAAAVEAHPRDRDARMDLVRGFIDAGQLEDALVAVRAWRAVDAYNLVVVRMEGDILTELKRPADALRVYSAVTELLTEDPEAQRALATVLKQQGDVTAAHARLSVARKLRPDDLRLRFELADVALRLDRRDEALRLLETISGDDDAPDQLVYPAKQRLAQGYAAQRRDAARDGRTEDVAAFNSKIEELHLSGGTVNDIKVYLTWDTDRTDVDLWVRTPGGSKVYYDNRTGSHGESLFDDVTSGYGPESFSAKKAAKGTYKVQVNYFGGAGADDREARGEVLVVLNEGRDDETQQTFPYRLYHTKQTVTVAAIEVAR